MFKTRATEAGKNPKIIKYRKRKNSSSANRPFEDWIGIPVTPIMDLKVWEKAQKLLKINAYRSHRNNNKNHYLLRGLVLCGVCGSVASGNVSNKHTYYSCRTNRCGNVATKPHSENISISHPELDDKVWSGLVQLLNDPNNLKRQLEKKLELREPPFVSAGNSSPDVTDKDFAKLDLHEQRIIDAYREGAISLAQLKEQKAKIATKRKSLQVNRNAVLSQMEGSGRPEITFPMLGDVSARFRRVMATADFATREKLVNLVVNRVILQPDKVIVEGNIPVANTDVLNPAFLRSGVFLHQEL